MDNKDYGNDVYIRIHSVHGYDMEQADTMDFMTEGRLHRDGDICRLSYEESEITGMPGTMTVLSVGPEEISVDRKGTVNSNMLFREGLQEAFLLNTPYGSAKMGIDTRRITRNIGEDRGSVEIDYVVNMDHAFAMRNKISLNFEKQGGQA